MRESSNGREGIKTASTPDPRRRAAPRESSNAREGIKTQGARELVLSLALFLARESSNAREGIKTHMSW